MNNTSKQFEVEKESVVEALYEMNNIMNCGLDKESLVTLLSLCEMDANPEALALVVKEIRNEHQIYKDSKK